MGKEELREYLMQLDREFDRATSEKGVDGWVSYFEEDGIMVPANSEVIKGKEAIREAMEPGFALTDFSLRWEPLDAEISEDGSMGYTYGTYVRSLKDKDGNVITKTGKYTSIWRRQEDGSYKISLDTGN